MAKKIDPTDGAAYTYEEYSAYYKGTYKKKAIDAAWEDLKPAKKGKAKSKAKAKAEPEPKAKAKAKAKVKAKAKAKAAVKKKILKVIKEGDTLPSIEIDCGFNPIDKVNILERCKDKKVVILGLPGAFTPCWSSVQVPGYLSKQDELKAKGIDEVLVYCVNDGAVMKAWAKDQKVEGSIITFLADTSCRYSRKIGMVMSHKGPKEALGGIRCKRHVLIVENGVVKNVEVSEAEDDPAGDNEPEGPITAKTRVEHILELL